MQPRPAIAILTPGILTALGLKSILEKLIPMAEVDAFDDAQALEESGMERYFHFFVATRCFVGHSALFAPVRKRVILLTSGQPQPEFAGFRCLDILRPEGDLIRDIMRMHHGHTTATTPKVSPRSRKPRNSRPARPKSSPSWRRAASTRRSPNGSTSA